MTKRTAKHSLRENKPLEFTTLRDGRKIVKSQGGKLKRRDIRRAVEAVVAERRALLAPRG